MVAHLASAQTPLFPHYTHIHTWVNNRLHIMVISFTSEIVILSSHTHAGPECQHFYTRSRWLIKLPRRVRTPQNTHSYRNFLVCRRSLDGFLSAADAAPNIHCQPKVTPEWHFIINDLFLSWLGFYIIDLRWKCDSLPLWSFWKRPADSSFLGSQLFAPCLNGGFLDAIANPEKVRKLHWNSSK